MSFWLMSAIARESNQNPLGAKALFEIIKTKFSNFIIEYTFDEVI